MRWRKEMETRERISWEAEWFIHRFKDPTGEIAVLLQAGMRLEAVVEAFPVHFLSTDRFEGNVALNEGLQALIELICGISSPTAWDNSNARIGVGDSSDYEAYTRECAEWLQWRYERLPGDARLIQRFVAGDWGSEDFLIVKPGHRIEASNDEAILRAVPAGPPSADDTPRCRGEGGDRCRGAEGTELT